MSHVCFTCPRCQSSFPVVLEGDQFTCPECSARYQFTRVDDRNLGWVSETEGRIWETKVIQPIDERFAFLPELPPGTPYNVGAARARKLMRQRRQRSGKQAAVFFLALVLAGLFLLNESLGPAIAGNAAPEALPAELTSIEVHTPEQIVPAPPTATPQPAASQQPTASPTATLLPTRTPTPLPKELLIATAWQATLDQAVAVSHAMQTQNAAQYAATLTALPPTLTVMATERSIAATATALAKGARP